MGDDPVEFVIRLESICELGEESFFFHQGLNVIGHRVGVVISRMSLRILCIDRLEEIIIMIF